MVYWAAKEYGLVNARIRGMKARLVTIGGFERMLQSEDYKEFIDHVMDTHYAETIALDFPEEDPNPYELSTLLARDFASTTRRLLKALSGRVREFIGVYLNSFYSESIKSIIRGVHAGLDTSMILRFTVATSPAEADEFERLAKASTIETVIGLLSKDDLRTLLVKQLDDYDEFGTTAPLEVAVEEWYLNSLLDALSKFNQGDQNRVLESMEARTVLRNAITMIRILSTRLEKTVAEHSMIHFTPEADAITETILSATSWEEVLDALKETRYAEMVKRMADAFEETKSPAELELLVEDYIAQKVKKQLTLYPFHLGTVFAFFSLKFYEVRNIRSIAVGIERGESADTIRRMITIV